MDKPYQILIVEDSETQALKLRCILEDQGWSVCVAATVQAALEKINRTLPDLIVVDYHLPGVTGDEFCRKVRMNVETRSVPMLMFTADDTQAAQLRSLESGADDYIPKSTDADILLLRVRALLRKSSVQTSRMGPSDSYFHKARLLAIDDSPTYLEFLSQEFESEGYTVEKAASGSEGLKRLETEIFDCVLVDLMMPDMDGITVCRELNRMRRGMNNPIIVLMLTARENKEDMTQGLEAGADDFVGKSSDKAVLKGRIRALLRRKFFQEENQRILEELKNKELEMIRAKAAQEVAETRAALVDKLEKTGADLARANRELEAFSYSVSHDLRAPLRHVLGFVELLQEEAGPSLSEKSLRHLATISRSAKRMGDLIDDLLAFSHIGQSEIQKTEVHLDRLVRDALGDFQVEIRERNIVWKIDPLPPVWADRGLLRMVLVNLISNAVKFTGDRAEARIEIGSAPNGNDESVIFIRDNGAGFDPKYVGKLFGVFQRLHRQDEFEGTGIGLANVQRIIHRHGGRVWAESVVDAGATFSFSIPKQTESL
jgi:two-component system NtrC family sensor kinase